MAVTVTDNRTVLTEADAYSVATFNTGADHTTIYAEATGCIAVAYNIATGQIYFLGTMPNFTTAGNELIYVWSAIIATQNGYKEATPENSSHAMHLSDGTNRIIIYMTGNDRDVFKHSDGQVTFQCFLVDVDYLSTLNTNGDLAALAGSFAAFNAAAITQVGAHYTTLSKALGGGVNCYLDIIRYGTEGISITAGTTGDRGNFEEICIEDRSIANLKAHGIIREYTAGAYGCQGTLKFGSTGTITSWFQDSGISLVFEDRPVLDDKFKFYILGNTNASYETHFILNNSTISSARPGVLVDLSSTGINELLLNSVNFVNLLNSVTFPIDSTSYSHTVNGCGFSNCGQISPGTVDFINCIISNSNSSVTGALLIDSNSNVSNWSGLTFNSGGSGHAIYITQAGTYTFDDFTFSDYGITGSTDAAIYNNSGGAVVINLVNTSSSPTYRNGAGASTTVNLNVTLTLTGIVSGSEVRIQEARGIAPSGAELYHVETTDGSNVQWVYNYAIYGADYYMDIIIHNIFYTHLRLDDILLQSFNTTIPIQQMPDRWYNP